MATGASRGPHGGALGCGPGGSGRKGAEAFSASPKAMILLALFSFGGAMLLAHGSSGVRTEERRTELATFPSGRALPVLRMGHAPLAADLAWLRAVQYYGQHRLGDRSYPLAEHLFRIITGLDPAFEQAYVFGALVLAEDARQPDRAEELLTRGMAALPGSWWIAFERGFLRMIHLGSHRGAARDFDRASRLPGSPPWVARFAAWSYQKAGDLEEARQLWRLIARETDNPMIREIARRALERLEERGTGRSRPGDRG